MQSECRCNAVAVAVAVRSGNLKDSRDESLPALLAHRIGESTWPIRPFLLTLWWREQKNGDITCDLERILVRRVDVGNGNGDMPQTQAAGTITAAITGCETGCLEFKR